MDPFQKFVIITKFISYGQKFWKFRIGDLHPDHDIESNFEPIDELEKQLMHNQGNATKQEEVCLEGLRSSRLRSYNPVIEGYAAVVFGFLELEKLFGSPPQTVNVEEMFSAVETIRMAHYYLSFMGPSKLLTMKLDQLGSKKMRKLRRLIYGIMEKADPATAAICMKAAELLTQCP